MSKRLEPSEMPEPDVTREKKKDMLSKARNKLYNLGDALKSGKYIDESVQRRSRTQATLDYFFKPCPNKPDKNQIYSNNGSTVQNGGMKRAGSLQKQHSVGSYPIKIDLSDPEDLEPATISRLRPATICVDKVNEARETAALALERPRKKLSFREPEIMGYSMQTKNNKKNNKKSQDIKLNGTKHIDFEDVDLESQAMRVVRTVGQAFEVCHKLSITAPENENVDYDEQETLTQDLVSDRLSDITSDKPKKDALSEGASDKLSLADEGSFKDLSNLDSKAAIAKTLQLDVLPPPPTNSARKSPLTGETYAAPHSDNLLCGGSGSGGGSSIPAAGSALSVHHELQLLREQLDQQNQQTQAAMAQLQLAREQLAAEQSARLEAQARTHQLLVHNRELLDHIAALVAHLQGSDKATNLPQGSPLVTMPQQQQQQGLSDPGYHGDHSETNSLEHSPVLQALGLNPQGLIENRAVTSCLPPSPLRTTFNPAGGVFNFNYPQDISLETQLLQRLQALSGYTPPQYGCNYNQNLAFLPQLYANPLVNNNYTLQPPPQKKFTTSPLPMRHSFASSPVLDRRISPASDQYQSQQSLQFQSQQNLQLPQQQPHLNQNLNQTQNNNLQVRSDVQQQQASRSDRNSEPRYIKPLSQMGTLTTTDSSGRLRVIVPVPSNADDTSDLLASLRLGDDLRPNNPPAITRSTSEKVPNRSELMSQVQRTTWARHTTK